MTYDEFKIYMIKNVMVGNAFKQKFGLTKSTEVWLYIIKKKNAGKTKIHVPEVKKTAVSEN